ncbi:agouti signaling protein 1 [Thalassophryne amazonica]|uniref:agouti signaling protein 1 n=1 Tax=Thalassophryne amazonica TaxID=390379 RepID=UPI0014720C83|nr:agouti signaling protein 1 [Thalassophryne amazonica]
MDQEAEKDQDITERGQQTDQERETDEAAAATHYTTAFESTRIQLSPSHKKMQTLSCLVLATTAFVFGSAYMIPDEKLFNNRVSVSNALPQSLEKMSPPVVIVEVPDSSSEEKKTKKQKKNKSSFGIKNDPPPPANCIPLWGSCKSPNNVCCDFCAFCQCRLFRTVCFCRMGNPHC